MTPMNVYPQEILQLNRTAHREGFVVGVAVTLVVVAVRRTVKLVFEADGVEAETRFGKVNLRLKRNRDK